MKKWFSLLLALTMALSLAACSAGNTSGPQESQPGSAVSETPAPAEPDAAPETPEEGDAPSTLVAYFSATGNTEGVAEAIAQATGGNLFAITPADPYTSADLDWTDADSRVVYEHDNPDERDVALVADTVENWEEYNTVFIGYPIWWGIAAWPVDGFVEANDFTGKTVIPFCTSSSSGLGESGQRLSALAGTGTWLEGQRFRGGASQADVSAWVESLGLV